MSDEFPTDEELEARDEVVDQTIRALEPHIRSTVTEAITPLIDEVVATVLSDVRRMLEDGVCSFDFHVSPCEFDNQSNCRSCGKHSSQHERVHICK